jgi:HPt (histidine-containing phosphotransfer) domain-containing protein
MIEMLEDAVNKCLTEIIKPIDERDWKNIKQKAHALKGSSSYIGAGRLHYVCYYIQDHHYNKNYQKMIDYYPSLVEAAIEFKIYSKVIIAKYKKKTYIPSSKDE